MFLLQYLPEFWNFLATFWLPWFCLICKLSWSRACRAPFAPRRSCIVSRARLIQILTIRTLCLHRDFVSYPTQLIQILRGSQQEKLLCKRSTSKVISAKNGDLKSSIIGFASGWVHTLMWYDPSWGRRVLDTKSILGFGSEQLAAADAKVAS